MVSRKIIRTVTRDCVTCRRVADQPFPLLLGQLQLPHDRLNPGMVFDKVEVDYARSIMVKSGPVHRPMITKAYMCVFASFAVKSVHLEAVSELTTTTFIACLHKFIPRPGKPSTIWSDHGTNYVGAARELKDFYTHLKNAQTEHAIDHFCTDQDIQRSFAPEHAPHSGGLWEAAVMFVSRLRS